MSKINIKKATGVDGIPAKIVKLSKSIMGPQITTLINTTIESGVFPDRLKEAQVTPIYKKSDALQKSNYRPVSVLSIISKIYEKVLEIQLISNF